MNKIDKPSAILPKREKSNKTRSERENINSDSAEIQRIIGGYYEQLHTKKLDKIEKNG